MHLTLRTLFCIVLHVKEKLVACFVSFQLIDAGKLLNKYNFPKQAIGFAGREFINTYFMCYTRIHTKFEEM